MAERRKFSKVIDGEEIVQYATTPAEAVRFTYDGWREQKATAPAETEPAGDTAPAPARTSAKKTTAAGDTTTAGDITTGGK